MSPALPGCGLYAGLRHGANDNRCVPLTGPSRPLGTTEAWVTGAQDD